MVLQHSRSTVNMKKQKSGLLLFIITVLLWRQVVIQSVNALPPPTLQWSRTVPGLIVQSSPSSVSLDGGTKDIVVGSWDNNAYGIRGEDGNNAAGWPKLTAKRINSSAAVADVDSTTGGEEIFIGSGVAEYECSGGGMYSYATNGGQRFHFKGYDNVTNGGNAPCYDLAMHGSPALGDTNSDGVTDVLFGALGIRTWSIKSIGAYENFGWWFWWDDTQFASPALADINSDGLIEIIAGGDSSPQGYQGHKGGLVRALTANGQELWQFRTNEIVYSSPAVGDVDNDGKPEVVFGTGNYWANNGGASDSTKIFVLDHTGKLQWSKDLGAQTLASPALADLNGDGVLDIAIGTWEGAQQGKIWALNGSGANLPGYPLTNAGGNKIVAQVSTADFDNDGAQDILATTGNGAYAYSGDDGSLLFTLRGFGSFQSSPLIEDLDGDGLLDIVIAGTLNGTNGVIERWEMPSTDASLGTLGWPKFRKDARQTGSWLPTPLKNPPSGNKFEGYWMAGANGQVYSFGSAKDFGSAANIALAKPIVDMSTTPLGQGYWLLGGDGGIFTYGDSQFFGSTGNMTLNQPVNGITPTPSGNGYWLVASDGGIFTFGNAQFYGSTGAMTLNKPVVGMAATPSGNGYWIVASDGGIFTYGDAQFFGSTGAMTLNKPIVGMASTPDGGGYWLVASDGGIFSFGNAPYLGSTGNTPLASPISGMTSLRNSPNGYWMVAQDGGIFSFGGAAYYGSFGGSNINIPVTTMNTVGY